MSTGAGGQTERHCGKVGGRSDALAPANDSPGVYTAGQGHGRCYRIRILDQISALVAVADGGEGVGGAGSMGSWGSGGVRNDIYVFLMPYVCMSEACKSLHSHISLWGFAF